MSNKCILKKMNDIRVYDFFFDMFLKKKDFIRKKKGRKKKLFIRHVKSLINQIVKFKRMNFIYIYTL